MPKGQQRSNKEVKKPKAKKPPTGPAVSSFQLKGSASPVTMPKKKA
jgi:hypothetical protein